MTGLNAGQTFHGLNAMRGCAAICVYLYHEANVLPGGYFAVDLFFCLSGFVIALNYDERLATDLGFAGFMRLRLIRLYPLYLLAFAFSLAQPGAWPVAAANIVLLPAMSGKLFPANVPAWSLFYELLVNILFAATHRWLSDRVVLIVAASAAGVLALFGIVLGETQVGSAWPLAPLGLARVLIGFSAGVLIFRAFRAGRLPRATAPWPVVCFLMVGLFAIEPMPNAAAGTAIGLAVVLAVVPALVILGANSAGRWPVLCTWLASMSYPLYILHRPLGMLPGLRAIDAAHPWLFGLWLLAVSTVVAAYYDTPVRRWLSRLGRRVAPA